MYVYLQKHESVLAKSFVKVVSVSLLGANYYDSDVTYLKTHCLKMNYYLKLLFW